MAIRGIGASLKLDNGVSPSTLTDVSSFLNNIATGSDVDRLPTTVFQPNVANPLKTFISGGRDRTMTLTGRWTAAAETFFSGIEGVEDLEYEYGPEGTTTGKTKISGRCNCLNYSGPQSDVDGITPFTVELSVTTRTVSTY